MRSAMKIVAAFSATAGLLASSTAAVAAAPVSNHSAYQAPNAWVMLSSLSSAAATQPSDAPPPPPPPGPPLAGPPGLGVSFGELLPFALWFGLIAVALSVSDDGGRRGAIGNPNSPA